MERDRGARIKNANVWAGFTAVSMQPSEGWNQLKQNTGASDPALVVVVVDPRKTVAASGIKQDDIILTYNGTPATVDGLVKHFANVSSGETIDLQIIRNDRIIDVPVTKP